MVDDKACYALDGEKHVFVDWSLVEPGYGVAWAGTTPGSWEMPTGIRLAVHEPRIDDGPILRADKPWEASVGSHGTVFDDGGVYRFFYRVRTDTSGDDGSSPMMLAYAESTDGATWTKPKVGTVEFQGSKDNNIVYGLDAARGRSVNSACVFKDPAGGASDRYKLLYRAPNEEVPHIYGAVSPDGLHWETLDDPLIPNYFSDTHNVAAFDPKRGEYVAYVRGWTAFERGALHGRRTISRAATSRFDRWPRPEMVYAADALDGPDTDIYTNAYTPWPDADAYLMFPAFYQRKRGYRRGSDVDQPRWSVLGATNSDARGIGGRARNPLGGRLLRWSGTCELPARRGFRCSCRLPGTPTTRDTLERGGPRTSTGDTGRTATWRRDGFVSLESPDEGGFTTIPITFQGSRLTVNAWTRFGGEIRFELADASPEHMGRFGEGRPAESATAIPGRSFDACDPFTGDSVSHTVTWNGEADISQWATRPVRLRVRMRRARLYALRVV